MWCEDPWEKALLGHLRSRAAGFLPAEGGRSVKTRVEGSRAVRELCQWVRRRGHGELAVPVPEMRHRGGSKGGEGSSNEQGDVRGRSQRHEKEQEEEEEEDYGVHSSQLCFTQLAVGTQPGSQLDDDAMQLDEGDGEPSQRHLTAETDARCQAWREQLQHWPASEKALPLGLDDFLSSGRPLAPVLRSLGFEQGSAVSEHAFCLLCESPAVAELSYQGCMDLFAHAVLPAVLALDQSPSRSLATALLGLTTTHAHPAVQGLVMPLLEREGELSQPSSDVVQRVTKEGLSEDALRLFLHEAGQSPERPWSATGITCVQLALNQKPRLALSPQELLTVSVGLLSQGRHHAGNLKFWAMVLHLIKKYNDGLSLDREAAGGPRALEALTGLAALCQNYMAKPIQAALAKAAA